MRWVVAFACALGCGRIGFSAREDAHADDAIADTALDAPSGPFIQAECTQAAAATATQATTLPAPAQAGDLLVVVSDFIGITQTGALTDTLGTTYSELPIARSNAQTQLVFYGVAPAGGPDTATLTLSASSSSVDLQMHEYRGPSALVMSNVSIATSAAPLTPALAANAGDLVFAYAAIVTATVTGVAMPFIPREVCHRNMTADTAPTAAGNYQASFTADQPFRWIARIAVFR